MTKKQIEYDQRCYSRAVAALKKLEGVILSEQCSDEDCLHRLQAASWAYDWIQDLERATWNLMTMWGTECE